MKLLTFSCSIILSSLLFGQSISDQLGAIASDIKIFSNDSALTIQKQFIIERPVVRSNYSDYENQSYGYGYSYIGPHLEFVTTTPIQKRRKTKEDSNKSYLKYDVELLDENGNVLVARLIEFNEIRKWTNNDASNPLITYSLNLSVFPLILFDEAHSISIVQINNH